MKISEKDGEIEEYLEKLEALESITEKLRTVERENSEMKAAKLMSMYNGSSTSSISNPAKLNSNNEAAIE